MRKAIILIVFLMFAIACSSQKKIVFAQTGSISAEVQNSKGIVLVAFSADAKELDTKNLNIKINSIEIGGLGKENIVHNTDREIDFVQLRNNQMKNVVAQMSLDEGKYSKIMLAVESKDYIMPSNRIEIPVLIDVKKESFAIIELNFLLDSSLRNSADSKKIFAPVINIRAGSAKKVSVATDRTFSAQDESQTDKTKLGMNLKGAMVPGEGIWSGTQLEIKNNKITEIDQKINYATAKEPEVKEANLLIDNKFINPSKLSVKANETTKINLFSPREKYNILIEGYSINLVVEPNSFSDYTFTPENTGAFRIICNYPCAGKVIGQMIVER